MKIGNVIYTQIACAYVMYKREKQACLIDDYLSFDEYVKLYKDNLSVNSDEISDYVLQLYKIKSEEKKNKKRCKKN